MSLELRLAGRQSLSMSHREREIVPDGGANGIKGALSWKFLSQHVKTSVM